jgi:hypothetical protein
MLITNRVRDELEAAKAFAAKAGLAEDLAARLRYLDEYAHPKNTRCTLSRDSAPYSFEFVMEVQQLDGDWRVWFVGGLLYHGPHDGHGSGSGPTFACTLTPTRGWSIHT